MRYPANSRVVFPHSTIARLCSSTALFVFLLPKTFAMRMYARRERS